MEIYIDESGTFSGFGGARKPSVVGALIIPEAVRDDLFARYAALRLSLPKDKGEVKGRQLSAAHVASVVAMVRPFPIIFEATAIDPGMHDRAGVEYHRTRQAQGVTHMVDECVHQSMRDGLWELRRELEAISLQLYMQATATFELISRIQTHATMYYAQRLPKELAAFHWIVDAKDKAMPITAWEKWWSYTVMPMVQSKSRREPMAMLKGADYSHFDRFMTDWEEWAFPGVEAPEDGKCVDIKKIMSESFRFSNKPEPGLELVDILANATRRALIGNLEQRGWGGIPSLMIHRNSAYIQLMSLQDVADTRMPYARIIRAYSQSGRVMLLPDHSERAA